MRTLLVHVVQDLGVAPVDRGDARLCGAALAALVDELARARIGDTFNFYRD